MKRTLTGTVDENIHLRETLRYTIINSSEPLPDKKPADTKLVEFSVDFSAPTHDLFKDIKTLRGLVNADRTFGEVLDECIRRKPSSYIPKKTEENYKHEH